MQRLKGRVALVSGAGQGIGRAIALAFGREGARLGLAELEPDRLATTQAELDAIGAEGVAIPCDVGRREDCERAVSETVEAFGGLDVLVNCAAWAKVGVPVAETSDDLYARTMDVCMTSVFWTSRAAFPYLEASPCASVINFASNAGTEGMSHNAVYAAAKEAIRGFSRSCAREWGPLGIRVNMLRPIAASPSVQQWIADNPKVAAQQAERMPLGRYGDPERDIAPVAVFLASDESRYLTGVTLPADGGAGLER